MSDLGFNKIAAGVLATALGYMLIREVPHFMFHVDKPDTPAYALEIPEVKPAGEEEVELPFPQADWVAAMDEEKGAKVFKKCVSCHVAESGGAPGTGPNLWNVVGSAAASKTDFGYSSAMTGAGITWGYEELEAYLEKPTRYVKGTAMNFIGLKKPADRAAVIEYLRVRSDSPVPRPAAATMEASLETTEMDAVIAKDDAEGMIEGEFKRSPASADARVFFKNLEDGATVSSPLTIEFGVEGMTLVPAGEAGEFTGHHHILVDRAPFGQSDLGDEELNLNIPTDDNHVHYGKAQTEATLELAPGTHTLQMVLGDKDHIPHDPPVVSEQITITVE